MPLMLRIVAGLFAAGCLVSCSHDNGEFTLVNAAQETIAQVTVSICAREFQFGPLRPGESGAASYRIDRDDGFKVRATFVSGRTVPKEDGYVTTGMSFRHRIAVTDAGITVTEGRERTEGSARD